MPVPDATQGPDRGAARSDAAAVAAASDRAPPGDDIIVPLHNDVMVPQWEEERDSMNGICPIAANLPPLSASSLPFAFLGLRVHLTPV